MCDKITSEPSQDVPENPSPLGTQLSPEGCHGFVTAQCQHAVGQGFAKRASRSASPTKCFQTRGTEPGGRRGQRSAPAQPIAMLNHCLANLGGKNQR